MTVKDFLTEKSAKTEAALDQYLAAWDKTPDSLMDAMRYSLFAGGKRLRPALVLGASEVISGDDTPGLPAACALEMIHTYSLIHDDLPAMDDDDLRRGKPTSHKVYGEATAILAGDALLTMAFEVAAQSGDLRVIHEIAQAAGVQGMVGGQQLDMDGEDQALDLDGLRRIHAFKTGALIRVSIRCGAILGGAEDAQIDALTRYGEAIGLAFQIADDILDVVGTEEALGKPIGSDEGNQKSTYPALLGLDGARKMAQETVDTALEALTPFGEEADIFRDLAKFIIERDR